MARIKRPRYLCFFSEDFPFLDIDQLLRGRLEQITGRQLCAFSILRGETVELSADELELVLATPSGEWIEAEDEERSRSLARRGILLVDDADGELAELRRRDERLTELNWNLESAVYHFAARWRDVELREDAADLPPPGADAVREFVEAFGMPPPAFRAGDGERIELPVAEREGQLYDALLRRRTTRSFDRERPLPLRDLAAVLHYVFGYQGYARLLGEITTLKRTSPSAGGFHPVEAYPLLLRVDGVPPGLYRYDSRDHLLERLAPVEPGEGRELAARFVCGQTYFADAHALVVLAVRFERAFWKYRNHQKALTAVLMDAAHLSQTLYLVCTELGLGAFVTAAVNNADIDERLGLDGYGEGTVAVCGFGVPAAERSPFDPVFEPLA
ncbi:MAG: putative peptide maturation dehydrogenase [Gaiellaceae bacterium]